jgi:hypothetical protein
MNRKSLALLIASIILTGLFTPGCSSLTPATPSGEPLKVFFGQCEQDINRAADVVLEHDLVKNLTHLSDMNRGGRKYYILERESTTRMINAVTAGIYSDYILINRHGRVVYTRTNDRIFGMNVRGSYLQSTPLRRCYENREGIHIEDSSRISSNDNGYYLFISRKVSGENTMPGILILQVNVERLQQLLSKETVAIDLTGRLRLSRNQDHISRPYDHADLINLDPSPEERMKNHLVRSRTPLSYRYFDYRNLSWVLVRNGK